MVQSMSFSRLAFFFELAMVVIEVSSIEQTTHPPTYLPPQALDKTTHLSAMD